MRPHVELRCDGCEWAISMPLALDSGVWRTTHRVPEHRCENGRFFNARYYTTDPMKPANQAMRVRL